MRTMISASGLTKSYGRRAVLDGLTFVVPERARIGLIGRNGSGKTTLLRLLSGEETADAGAVTLMPGTRLGVLNQNETLPDDLTVLAHLTAASGQPTWEAERMASRFGLTAEDLARPPAALSGGYQMRVKLVRLLLTDPNLLLLDEPVNYLDLPTLLLLEAFLKRYTGAYIVTSHDRDVLEDLAMTTWEVAAGRLTVFPGPPSAWRARQAEQAEFSRRTNKKLRREIAHTQEFVDRFRYKASQASRAQSKMKYISKLRGKLRSLAQELPTVAFRIPCPPVTPGTAVRAEGLAVGYDGVVVAEDVNFEIPRGAKIAVCGENGRGKSTLLKTLAGLLPPVAGKLKWWHRADLGYFSQQTEEALAPAETVLQALTRAAPAETSGERILATAGAFLFGEDDLEKPCGVLSGGERARVRLAQLVLREHNVLLLDEPTNHLDVETVDVLAAALKSYPGTVILVSHNRAFTGAVAERVYEVRFGTVRQYLGNYDEYVADLAAAAEETDVLPLAGGEERSTDAAARREKALRDRERRRARERVEGKLKELDKEKGKIMRFFFEHPTDYAPEKQRRLAELDEEIARLEQEWYKLAEE